MRTLSRLTLLAGLLAACAIGAAAAPPAPLVKPVTPTGGGVRVRVPIIDDKVTTSSRMKALIPRPKGKKGETLEVKVLIDTLPSPGLVGLNTWKEWGFEVPANRIGVIPELIVHGAQLAPNIKERDVEFRATNVKVNIVEPAAGQDAVFAKCDVWLSLRDLCGGFERERTFEPRFYFTDKFFELTAPATAIKKLNTGEIPVSEPQATAGELVPVMGPMNMTGTLSFSFCSINGVSKYTTPQGKMETVNAGVSSITNYPPPCILVTVNTARGCGVELEKQPGDGETTVTGKVKELRLGLATGPGFKAQKDLVLKDVTVYVVNEKTKAAVWLGDRFIETYFTDPVYGCGPDGVWRLHGRVKPELLEDIKTRTPPKKP
jgi:hypothetical protein